MIGPDDVLVVGEQFAREDGVMVISTPYGEFQLLPRSLLITPFGQVLDLQAIRAELAAKAPATTVAVDTAEPSTTLVTPAADDDTRSPDDPHHRRLTMRSHPFDAVSAALGLIVVAIGAVVAFDGTDAIDTGWWLALGALVLGLGLIPWTRSSTSRHGRTDEPVPRPSRRIRPRLRHRLPR